jgi:hypothetical protein
VQDLISNGAAPIYRTTRRYLRGPYGNPIEIYKLPVPMVQAILGRHSPVIRILSEKGVAMHEDTLHAVLLNCEFANGDAEINDILIKHRGSFDSPCEHHVRLEGFDDGDIPPKSLALYCTR